MSRDKKQFKIPRCPIGAAFAAFIQFVLSLAQVWVASTRLRLAKKADEPAKASETEGSFEGEVASKEPSAEEPASKSESSGCVAS